MSEETIDRPAPPQPALLPDSPAASGTIPPPAAIVPVRAYAGETENEALARYGIDPDRSVSAIVFLHLS